MIDYKTDCQGLSKYKIPLYKGVYKVIVNLNKIYKEIT